MVLLLLVTGARVACASDYYVDCVYGSNGNSGTAVAPWRTPLKIGTFSANPGFAAGDHIYLRRDCTWNDGIVVTSSGTDPAGGGALITIDSYGNGRAPHLTGYLAIGGDDWSVYSGNVWVSKPLYVADCMANGGNCVSCWSLAIKYSCLDQPADTLNYVRFGTVWGQAAGSPLALTHDRGWYFDSTTQQLYVYASGGNPVTYYGQVTPIAISGMNLSGNGGSTLLKIQGGSWLEIQHLQMDWFDSYGVQVFGASDHLWLANMAANSEVENGAVPLGFYVHPDGMPADIHLYNTDASMNYAGYHFDGCTSGGCAFEIKNCRAYGNRAYGIVDNAQGAVSYDYCHLYANNLATAVTLDISGTPGPRAGTHNVAGETAPWIREWRRWPAYTTVSYDDPGLTQDSDTYIGSLLPMLAAKGIPLSIALVTGGSYSQSIIGEVQSWIDAGWDLNAHSISHEYSDPPATSCGAGGSFPVPCHALENLQYTGTKALVATLTISHAESVCGAGKFVCLIVTTSPDDPAADIQWNLTPASPGQAPTGLDTLGGILYTLQQRGVFSVSLDANAKSMARSISLADVTSLDIKNTAQNVDFDETQLEREEMSYARGWMDLNLAGLPGNRVYVMPGTYADPATENIAAGLGYAGVRGTGSLRPCCGADTTLAKGYDVYNILSQGIVPNYQGLSAQQMRNRIAQDVFKNALWGRPVGYFWHVNELRPDEVVNLADALVQSGARLESNTQMVNLLRGCMANEAVPNGYVAGSYHLCPGNGVEVRFTDEGWGASNDRNLVGRFNTRSFSLSRFARVQNFFVRRYDSSTPARYSRYSAALYVDYPL
jgi:hypothetical protein